MPRVRGAIAAACVLAVCFGASVASAAPPHKVIRFAGYRVAVPRWWPVLHVGGRSHVCVRFNQAAVFLGHPGSSERCPAHAAGRAQAILIEPGRGVVHRPVPERRAVTFGRLARTARSAGARAPVRATAAATVYTGLGFDACSAPSLAAMQAWANSPYRAIGVYLGGTNMACTQPNLTAAWVSAESTAGWHLIPTYVGLQAPTNSCSCAPIKARQATAEGVAAATDAVTQAQGLGLGPGTPIYDDMEYYPRTSTNTSAVLAYLSAWTGQLHAEGYLSGVYGNSNSVIGDMLAAAGTAFNQPDDIWDANWNGAQSTADPSIPATDWAAHQRIHQYVGGHNETYGGVRINIDGDYVDAATALGPLAAPPAPSLKVSPASTGSTTLTAAWPGVTGIASWQVLAGASPTTLTPFGSPQSGGASANVTVYSQFAYFQVEALGPTGAVVGISAPVATPPHLVIYGRVAFVPGHGIAGLPVGCFALAPCSLSATLTSGRTVVATSGRARVPAGGDRVIYFKLTARGRRLLSPSPGSRLPVQVNLTDSGGPAAKATINLVPFWTRGSSPARGVSDSPALQIAGETAFTYRERVGGILTGCFASAPCMVTATIRHGSAVIAQTGAEQIGAGELGYLVFRLTPQGRALFASRRTNQLGASVTMTAGTATASGRIVLVGYR
jgi:hypothetical protein